MINQSKVQSSRESIQTSQAPMPVGAYNQAVKVGPWLYLSGQIGMNPQSNEMKQGSF